MAVRAGAQLGSVEMRSPASPTSMDEDDASEADARARTIHEFFLRGPRSDTVVTLYKETQGTRIGIGLRPDMPDRAVVNTVAPGTPASQPQATGSSVMLIEPYDELLEVAGTHCSSAVHAVSTESDGPRSPSV